MIWNYIHYELHYTTNLKTFLSHRPRCYSVSPPTTITQTHEVCCRLPQTQNAIQNLKHNPNFVGNHNTIPRVKCVRLRKQRSLSPSLYILSLPFPPQIGQKKLSLERNLLGPTSFLFLIFSSFVQSNGGKLAFTLSLFLPSSFPVFLLSNQTDLYICKVFYLLFSFSLISSVQSNGGKLSFTFYIFLPSYFPPFLLSNQQTLTFVKSLSTILFLLNDLEKNKKIVINFGFPKNNDTFFP